VNGATLTHADDLFDALDGLPDHVAIGVVRGSEELEVTVRFDTASS
jgi:hypothetical protein